ncbi:MAG: hypothetical protein DLM57_15555 [Pseudonocardiales bacterium]|nr:MAG: hypothetical protein DLM57_15555 [Pseudonocardiales bacterium]
MDRLREARIRGGLLSVEEAAALSTVGFEPVCEVLGAVANRVGTRGFYTPAARPQFLMPRLASSDYRTYTSSMRTVAVGVPQSILALKAGYRTALSRLTAEASAAGADGVVGLTIQRTVLALGEFPVWTFLAIGTAVRSVGRVHAANPFTTDLSAAQTAAAIRGGWLPVSYLFAPCRAIRAVDPVSSGQRARAAPNGEIDAYTDLVTSCRRQARADFTRAAAAVHADGAVQSSMTLDLHVHPRDVGTAQVTITGTALARFRARGVRPHALTIMPLKAGVH